MNDRRQDCGRNALLTSDPHLSDRRIGQELDVPDALSELVERRVSPRKQCAAIDRRLDTARTTIEKAYAERMLELGDHLGTGRLAHTERFGRLRHAVALHGGEEDVQI